MANRWRFPSANVANGDPSAKQSMADGDHFCECGERTAITNGKRADRHLMKPDIVVVVYILPFPIVGSNAMNTMSADEERSHTGMAQDFGVFFGKEARA